MWQQLSKITTAKCSSALLTLPRHSCPSASMLTAAVCRSTCCLNACCFGQITETDADGLDSYPELDIARLAVQLAMFKLQFSYQTLHEAKARLQGMTTEVRTMFSEVEQLVRLMLLCPVSSCEAERSFSCLRRLKIWLRCTMTQQRLNSIIVCHVNQEVLGSLPISAITAEFAGRSDIQRSVFGNGPF